MRLTPQAFGSLLRGLAARLEDGAEQEAFFYWRLDSDTEDSFTSASPAHDSPGTATVRITDWNQDNFSFTFSLPQQATDS